jgi:opacity protein-like surface antigen
MKKLLLTFVFVAAPCLAAAADLPIKRGLAADPTAPVPCSITACSGFYIGGHVEGEGSNADILGSGINGSIFANGAGLGLHAGYQLWNGNFFAAGEFGGTYDVGSRTVIGDIANVSPWSFEYLAKLGVGLNGLFNSSPTPTQGPINVIQALNGAMLSPYAIVGGKTRNFGSGFVTGAGVEYTLGGHWAANVEYLHVNYNDQTAPVGVNVSIGTENVVRAGLNYKF